MPYMDQSNAERLTDEYADMILRISYMYLKQTYDAEDICQEVFLKLLSSDYEFESPEHERSWIIRTAINACKDHLRTSFWKRRIPIDSISDIPVPAETESEILEQVMTLPRNYRLSIYLHYYEGYRIKEIAEMLGKQENTVSAYLHRGRRKLRQMNKAEIAGTAGGKGVLGNVQKI